MIYHNVYITMIIYRCLKLRSQNVSLWSPGMCMSCFFFFVHMRVHMCIYKYYYLFICSIILKYCKYTCLIKYISISIYMDLPIRNQSCFFVRTVSIVYIVTDMVDQSGYCRLITTKSVCYSSLENPPTIISTAQRR